MSDAILLLLPIALILGLTGLCALIWAVRSGQYNDIQGDASRILFDDETLSSHPNDQGDHHEPS